eukprot:scaffold1558_cov199-Alexandrium_tamarense.AAC.7
MSFRLFVKLVEGNPAPFVFLYSSGNIMSLMSSMFLSGPQKQFNCSIARCLTDYCAVQNLIEVCFIPFKTGPKIGILCYWCKCVQVSGTLSLIFHMDEQRQYEC